MLLQFLELYSSNAEFKQKFKQLRDIKYQLRNDTINLNEFDSSIEKQEFVDLLTNLNEQELLKYVLENIPINEN